MHVWMMGCLLYVCNIILFVSARMHVWIMGCLLYVCNIILFVSCADACMNDGLFVVRL